MCKDGYFQRCCRFLRATACSESRSSMAPKSLVGTPQGITRGVSCYDVLAIRWVWSQHRRTSAMCAPPKFWRGE